MTTSTTTVPLFAWDRDYGNHEQVRPYLADFEQVKADILGGGSGVAYNSQFRGRIAGVAGSPNEDTAIYMLQNLSRLDELGAQVAAFLESGGEVVETVDAMRRGTVVHFGFYMGGTGWKQYDSARLTTYGPRNVLMVLRKGARTNGVLLSGGRVMIREA